MAAASIRKQRVTRIIYGVYVVGVAAFVVSSIQQVAVQVFFTPEAEAEVQIHPKVNAECEKTLRAEIESIEKARAAASLEANPETAKARYVRERGGADRAANATSITNKTCADDPHGIEATAALARLERAAETHSFQEAGDLRAVRRAAQSFIRVP